MQPRAAGVSPPWFGNATATSAQQRQLQVELLSLARRGSVTQLQRRTFSTTAHASRSWLRMGMMLAGGQGNDSDQIGCDVAVAGIVACRGTWADVN